MLSKCFNIFPAATIPAIFIILASYSGCNRSLAVGLFIASMAFMGGFYSSVKINAMDIAPNYAGTCSAFVNGLAAVSGIITPYLVGLLTPDVSFYLLYVGRLKETQKRKDLFYVASLVSHYSAKALGFSTFPLSQKTFHS